MAVLWTGAIEGSRGYRPRPIADRFWEKVLFGDGCWLWAAKSKTSDGYGFMMVGSKADGSRRPEKAHRIAWALTFGEPGDLFVLHECDTPSCVRPSHLFLGTQLDNLEDMRAKGRGAPPPRNDVSGEKNGHARLNWDQVREIRARIGQQSMRSVAKEFGISRWTVQDIVSGKNWQEAVL